MVTYSMLHFMQIKHQHYITCNNTIVRTLITLALSTFISSLVIVESEKLLELYWKTSIKDLKDSYIKL